MTGNRSALWALPNLLTYARIVAIPAVVWLMYCKDTDLSNYVACAIFFFAGISDYFDGYFARKWKITSELGKFLDPIADKLIVSAVLIVLVQTKFVNVWETAMTILIVSREIFVSGLREYLGNKQIPVPVSRLAKWKTAAQLWAIGFLICGRPEIWASGFQHYCYIIGVWLLSISTALTIITGSQYMRRAFAVMKN